MGEMRVTKAGTRRAAATVAALLAVLPCACRSLDAGKQGHEVAPPLSLTVSPSTVERGATATLALDTSQDFFNPNSTVSISGTGITVGTVLLGDSRHAAVVVTVAGAAVIGSRTVTASSGGRSAVGSLTVVVFSQAPRVVSIDPGAAPAGPRPLDVIAGATHIAGAFLVGRANSGTVVLDPPAAGQGEHVPVQVSGTHTHFDVSTLQVTVPYGSGLQVLGATVVDATHAQLDLQVATNAPVGPTTIYLINDLYVVPAAFEVWPAPIITLSPAEAVEGRPLTVAAAGSSTHFVDGVTTASSDGSEMHVDALRVVGPTAAEVDVTLPLDWLAAPVVRTLTLTTRWEIAQASFTVDPAARFTLAPSQLHQGESAQVGGTGQFTHFASGVTQAVVPAGAGFAVTGITVTSPTTAVLNMAVDLTAAVGPRTFELITGGESAAGTLTVYSLCAGVVCTAQHPCSAAGLCDPMTGACSDPPVAEGTLCRPAAGDCDLPEFCDGVSTLCPADAKLPSVVVCRTAVGACDLAETYDGVTAACPPDVRRSAGAVCRAAAGDCDAPEVCDGASTACPADAKRPVGFVCRAAAGDCDVVEACDGLADACPGAAEARDRAAFDQAMEARKP